MKAFHKFLFLLLINLPLFAQVPNSNPANNTYQRMQDSLLRAIQKYDLNEPEFAVPKRNSKLLAAIPKQVLTKEQLVQYLASLMNKFEAVPANRGSKKNVLKYFPPEITKDYQVAAVIFWINGRVKESIYAFLRAAQNSDDCLALNNISAMLNLSGYPHKAIPILKYLLEKYPKNKMVLNNMGQAYYELGDLNEAMNFLTGCTSLDRFNVQANNSIGHIEQSRGNTQQAMDAYTNSLNGGYNKSAAENLQRLKPEDTFKELKVPSPDKYPPADDNIAFQCPDPPLASALVLPFNTQMAAEEEEWTRLYNEYSEQLNESMQKNAQKMVKSIQSGSIRTGTSILFEKAVLMNGLSYDFTIDQMQRLEKIHVAWQEDFMIRQGEAFTFAQSEKCKGLSTEGCCKIMNEISEKYNYEARGHFMDYCEKLWTNVKGHYNVVSYWMPYITASGNFFNRDLFMARGMLITTAGRLCRESRFGLSNGCNEFNDTVEVKKDIAFKEPKCRPYNIPLGVGSIEIGCDIFKASGAEGIAGELELNFATSQVTIGLGAGYEVNTGIFNISQKGLNYIEFNTDNMTITDWGYKTSTEVTTGKILDPIGINSAGIEVTTKFGYESGITVSGAGKVFDQTLFDSEINIPRR